MRKIAQIFVCFSESLNFTMKLLNMNVSMQRHYLLKRRCNAPPEFFTTLCKIHNSELVHPTAKNAHVDFYLRYYIPTYIHKYKILHMKVSLYAILTMVKHEKVNSLQLYIPTTRYMHTCTATYALHFILLSLI